jgi:hypothetical protein
MVHINYPLKTPGSNYNTKSRNLIAKLYKTAVFNGQLYRYVKGWWIESFGPNGSGIVSGGVADPLGTLF